VTNQLKKESQGSDHLHPIEKKQWWRVITMIAIVIGALVGCIKVYEFYFRPSPAGSGGTASRTDENAAGPAASATPGTTSGPPLDWGKYVAERKAKEKAEAERDAVDRARVSKYWRTVAKGDTLEKVYAVIGEPHLKPTRDARTGKTTDTLIIYGGEAGLSLNIWLKDEKVQNIVTGVFRELEKKPELLGKNWQDVKVGDSAEAVLRHLGGPISAVGYDVSTDEILNQFWIFEDAAGLSLAVNINNGKVESVSATKR
jgi:hypothetical protein